MPYVPKYSQEARLERRKQLDYTYYSPQYAEAIRPIIEAMIADGRTRSFSCAKYGKTVGTLERLINRAINYLIDNCDSDDKRYYNFRRAVMVKKIYRSDETKNSVDIGFKIPQFSGAEPAPMDSSSVKSRDDEHESAQLVVWQNAVDDYINTGEAGTELVIGDLRLDDEGILAVKASVSGISDVELVSVNRESIILRKVK